MADELICLETPDDFMAVGSYYLDFTQVTDKDVVKILERSNERWELEKHANNRSSESP
jgi:predicted phosphoribosyltransferase